MHAHHRPCRCPAARSMHGARTDEASMRLPTHARASERAHAQTLALALAEVRTRAHTQPRGASVAAAVGAGGIGARPCAVPERDGASRPRVCARSLCAWPCVRPPYLGIGATCRCVRSEENELGSFMGVMRGRIAPNAWSVPRGVVGSAGGLRRTDTQARLRRTSIATSRSWSRARPSHGASLRAPHCVATSRMGGWLQPPKQP